MGWRPSLSVKEFLTHRPPANFYWKNSQSSFAKWTFSKYREREKGNIKILYSAQSPNIGWRTFERPETRWPTILWKQRCKILIPSSWALSGNLKINHQACLPMSGCSNDLVNPLLLSIFHPFYPPIIYPVYTSPNITTIIYPCFTRGLVSGYPWPWSHSKLKLNPVGESLAWTEADIYSTLTA